MEINDGMRIEFKKDLFPNVFASKIWEHSR